MCFASWVPRHGCLCLKPHKIPLKKGFSVGGATAAGGQQRRVRVSRAEPGSGGRGAWPGSAARPVFAMRLQQAPVSGKVFIQRDYSSGARCQFQTKFPAELENRIDRQQFEETVRTLNNLYAEAEKLGGQSYLEGCLACLTAYTIFLCMETHYEKVSLPLFSHNLLKS